MFGRTTFNGLTDTDLYRLEQISKGVERDAKVLQDRNPDNADFQNLTFLILQLGRVCTMQTQALRSIR